METRVGRVKYMAPEIKPRQQVSKAGKEERSCYDEDNLETITATAIKRPHRHFCQMTSAQPPEVLLELASTTALGSVVAGGAATGCGFGAARGCSTARCDVGCGWEGVLSDGFPRTDSPMFGRSRRVEVQYCAFVRYRIGLGAKVTYLRERLLELTLLNVPRVALTSPCAFVSIGRVDGTGGNFVRHHEGQ